MLVYKTTKQQFCEDVQLNRIESEVLRCFEEKLGHSTSDREVDSWRNSMVYMSTAVERASLPDDAGIAIEFRIPMTAKRVDFLVSGRNRENKSSVVIVELKQWQDVGITNKDAIVETWLGGAWRETTHPSYQAWSYAQLLRDFNESVYSDDIRLFPCAYLHNCTEGGAVLSERYAEHLARAPVYLREDVEDLSSFMAGEITTGDNGAALVEIDSGKMRPSKELAQHLASLLEGNPAFTMIDDQKLVYETALDLAKQASTDQKKVLLVDGGPGTGKSVVAINLLVAMIQERLNCSYVTRNSAPREVYAAQLSGSLTKTRIKNLFKGSGSFTETERGVYDCLIVDEAHRLNEKSGMFHNKGENQIKEIIHSSNFSTFFIDERQRVTLKDIGSFREIMKHAKEADAEVVDLELQSQFRCNGSDGFLAWIDNTLQIRPTANEDLREIDYDFKVLGSPAELLEIIRDKNQVRNRSRLLAGYCWPWLSKKDIGAMDIEFPEYNFSMQWNLADDGMLWLIKAKSVNQIGCIHTCQGLELDYAGIIIGPDLVVRDGVVQTDALERAPQDRSVFGYKKYLKESPELALKDADEIIKNTYRVLMTRGQKGCYVWSVDPETNEWLTACIGRS